ncbi:MAG: hypothetical protein J6I85_02265 [Clostridia bacterium]|nr:hypothetical protein [Clostridia bacterium]
MEFLIIIIIVVNLLLILKFIFDINLKEIKKIVEDKELDELTKKLPDNKEICKWYLKKLNNENVQIEENEGKQTCLYIWLTNKILIANIKNTYTRIQTIAHECLHSVQGNKILSFNFIYSNIYLIYFLIISSIVLFGKFQNLWFLFVTILIVLGMVYLLVRNYLENDAMIKARYLAKEYMEDTKILKNEEIEKIIFKYDEINILGIKSTNFYLFLSICRKIIIFSLICFIRIVAF